MVNALYQYYFLLLFKYGIAPNEKSCVMFETRQIFPKRMFQSSSEVEQLVYVWNFRFYTQSTHKGAPILSALYQWGKSFKIQMQSEYQSLFEHDPGTFKTELK